MFHADGRMDMTKLKVAFCKFAKAPNETSHPPHYQRYVRVSLPTILPDQCTVRTEMAEYSTSPPRQINRLIQPHLTFEDCIVTHNAIFTSRRSWRIRPTSNFGGHVSFTIHPYQLHHEADGGHFEYTASDCLIQCVTLLKHMMDPSNKISIT